MLIDGRDSTKKPRPYFHCGPEIFIVVPIPQCLTKESLVKKVCSVVYLVFRH